MGHTIVVISMKFLALQSADFSAQLTVAPGTDAAITLQCLRAAVCYLVSQFASVATTVQ
jgi:hypothetical protein